MAADEVIFSSLSNIVAGLRSPACHSAMYDYASLFGISIPRVSEASLA